MMAELANIILRQDFL